MLPLMMPIIVSIVFLQAVIEAPNSTLSVALSMFPFTAPIPMVVRVAMIDVPFWQVGLSFALLMASFVGAVWVSSRIYRIGILSYGKKTITERNDQVDAIRLIIRQTALRRHVGPF